jgi:hypothetical protein
MGQDASRAAPKGSEKRVGVYLLGRRRVERRSHEAGEPTGSAQPVSGDQKGREKDDAERYSSEIGVPGAASIVSRIHD